MPNSKQIVYLSQAQYAELIANGTITVDGVTVTYDENDIYVTPQAEPVTDVRINGTSITSNGLANIPKATAASLGVIKTNESYGITINSNGEPYIKSASQSEMKNGSGAYKPIVPSSQDISTFYGLAKVAGHDEKNSTESVGTYTPEAKGAIQSMLGVSDLIATTENSLVASKAYAIGDVFTANGKLYKATAAIAANDSIVLQNEGETVSGANAEEIHVEGTFVKNTDYASSVKQGIVKIDGIGIRMNAQNKIYLYGGQLGDIKVANSTTLPVTFAHQHESTFYGLAKAAGDTTQSQSDNAVGTYTDDAKTAIKSMIGVNVEDVQMMGTSVLTDGIANIPIGTTAQYGVVRAGISYGAQSYGSGNSQVIGVLPATDAKVKAGTETYHPLVPSRQHIAAFYGLAKAAGDTTQSASSNAVGTYTDNAKASIKSMLGIVDGSTGTVDVSGAAPTIAAVENTRYVCGEVTSLDFTPAASGVCIVRFTSGSTPTLLTLPSTIKFPEWFDSTALETDTIYEMCITDGVYGAVMSWAL